MVFVPMLNAPPKAGAKELSYHTLNLIMGLIVYIRVLNQPDLCRFV